MRKRNDLLCWEEIRKSCLLAIITTAFDADEMTAAIGFIPLAMGYYLLVTSTKPHHARRRVGYCNHVNVFFRYGNPSTKKYPLHKIQMIYLQ